MRRFAQNREFLRKKEGLLDFIKKLCMWEFRRKPILRQYWPSGHLWASVWPADDILATRTTVDPSFAQNASTALVGPYTRLPPMWGILAVVGVGLFLGIVLEMVDNWPIWMVDLATVVAAGLVGTWRVLIFGSSLLQEMAMVRGKFKVVSHIKDAYPGIGVRLFAVCDDGTPENERFHRYTPTGEITMRVDNPEAEAQFPIGREMYVDFTPVA